MSALVFPAAPAFRSSRFGLRANTQSFESPLTRSVQTIELLGARWFATYELPPMRRAQAAAWMAFLVALQGRAGRFLGFDPDCRSPRGTGAGTPFVKGEGQTGASLSTDGWAPLETVLKAGDYVAVNGELKMMTADAASDGGGNATLAFKPSLRAAPPDDAPLTLDDASCTMMLIDDEQAAWDADAISVFGLSFSGVETF
ncbi:MAG: hypothetical protein AB7P52_11575 [Alphaproteobacteria bacterium]